MPIVSVIVPCYNSARTLRRCLDSLRDNLKSFQASDVEVIVPLRTSTDETAEILETYPECKVLCHDLAGISRAYNLGIGAANGRFGIFLNSDDELAPNFVEVLTQKALTMEPECHVVYCSVLFIDVNGKPLYWRHPAPYCALLQKYYSIILHPNAIYPMGLLRKYPFEVLEGNPPRDRQQVYSLMQESVWSRTKETHYRYRIWSSSGTVQGAKKPRERNWTERVATFFGRIYVQSFETHKWERILRRRFGRGSVWRDPL